MNGGSVEEHGSEAHTGGDGWLSICSRPAIAGPMVTTLLCLEPAIPGSTGVVSTEYDVVINVLQTLVKQVGPFN